MKMGNEVVLTVEDLITPSTSPLCRICHEEEIESSKRLEAPCACSGTVKFAHRDCIQRWCNEKGNTTCEICLQKFKPGYTAPPKKDQSDEISVSIRGSLEVPRREHELHNPGLMAIVAADGRVLETGYSEYSSAAERSSSFCRSMALTLAMLLLVRDLLSVLTSGTDHYAFTILILFILRAGGVILPLYVLMRTILAFHKSLLQEHHDSDDTSPLQDEDEDEDDDEQLHPTVQIHSL